MKYCKCNKNYPLGNTINLNPEHGLRTEILQNIYQKILITITITFCPTRVLAYYSKNYIRFSISTLFEQLTKAVSYDTCTLPPIYVQNPPMFQYNKQWEGENPQYVIDSAWCYLFSLHLTSQFIVFLASS